MMFQEELSSTNCPTLMLHGVKDEVVPHTHSLELYRASSAALKVCWTNGLLLGYRTQITLCMLFD